MTAAFKWGLFTWVVTFILMCALLAGEQCGEKEEEFAHLYGQLFRECVSKLYKYKFWE